MVDCSIPQIAGLTVQNILFEPFPGNRQPTLRMDRHETIVAERCETFRYYCIVGVLG